MSPITRLLSFAVLALILKASAGPSLGHSSPAPVALAKARPASTSKASPRLGGAASEAALDPMYATTFVPTALPAGNTFDQVDGSYASPVPEEPTALMLVAGLGVLTVRYWKRRNPALD